ncbi:hypothetical protein GGI43DRAFT_415789 [Trichoderma evansii]
MQFKPLIILATALPFTQAQAALTAKDVVDAIHNLTNFSTTAWDIAKDINSNNILGSALKITDDLRQIVTAVTDDVRVLQSTSTPPTFPEHDQSDICESLDGLAKSHQDFFKTLASKKIFLDATTLTETIGTLLGLLGTKLNNLSEGVIALVPTCAAKARDELKDLDKTLREAVSAFTIHPPNTPTIQPLNATNEPLDIITQPLNATNEPLNTITQLLNATNEPLDAITQLLNTTNEPLNTITQPLDATNDPSNATNEPLNTIAQPLNTTAQPHHAPLPGMVGTSVSSPIAGSPSKPTEISASGLIGTPVVAPAVPFEGQ